MPRSSRLDPNVASRLSSLHSKVRLRQHQVAAPHPKKRSKQTRATSCTTSFGSNNLINIQLPIVGNC